MATFVERCCAFADYETDGGFIPPQQLLYLLNLYNDDQIDAAFIKAIYSMTTAQATQFDAVLATRPGPPGGGSGQGAIAFQFGFWPHKVTSIFEAAGYQWEGFTTAALVEAAVGI